MKKLKQLFIVIIAAFAVMLGGFAFAPSANATQTVVVKAKIVGTAVAEANATADSSGASAAYSYAAAQVRISKALTNKCIWTKGKNSVVESGKVRWFYEPVKAKVCKTKKRFWYGGHWVNWVKVGGGTSGSNCLNPFLPGYVPTAYKRASILDVRSGAIASVAVSASASVSVAVKLDATLEYTYEGKTYTIHRTASASGSDQETRSDSARMRIYKSTSLKSTKAAIDKKKAAVRTSARASARTNATAKARESATLKIDLTVVIDVHERPVVISAQAKSCVKKGEGTGVIDVTGENPNNKAATGTFVLGGQTKTASLAVNGRATVTFSGFAPGSYSGTFSLGEPINKSVAFNVTVLECVETDNPPVIVDLTRINDIDVNWSMTICATADFDKGHSGKLRFSFESGAITGTNPVSVADEQEGCVTLVAPSDPGTYTYRVTATDDTSGKSVSRESDSFTVNPTPVIPG